MKLLFDQNLSPHLVAKLADLFPQSAHVRNFGMAAAMDRVIWDCALQNSFVIVTQDSDFWERAMLSHVRPKILWIRLRNPTTTQVEALLRWRCDTVRAFIQDADAFTLELP